jgi:hypothetical protein
MIRSKFRGAKVNILSGKKNIVLKISELSAERSFIFFFRGAIQPQGFDYLQKK